MKQRKRIDENQPAIVEGLRRVGATAKLTTDVGGFVDIVVGYRGKNYLIEIKNPDQPKSKQVLTPDEQEFHDTWRGQVVIITTLDEALKIIGVIN